MSDRIEVDEALVARLVAAQFPQWAHLEVRPVPSPGWDNRTFRLGDAMSVRLPSAERYVAQVEKEHRWLPRLAPLLPLPIPVPLAKGEPGGGYPFPWSVYRWMAGEIATHAPIADRSRFARALAGFLDALYRIDASEGPLAGVHNFWRGGPVSVYDGQTRQAIETLGREIDTTLATEIWNLALASSWQDSPVWVHGDVASGNLLVRDGMLSAVIDFGSSGVGDPACDLYIAWTFFDTDTRREFRAALPLDEATWQRGRGWTLWKALIMLAQHFRTDASEAEVWRRVVAEVMADHRRETSAFHRLLRPT
jgi:aminoglycoside phosphotransferase (APT) family kinase protein